MGWARDLPVLPHRLLLGGQGSLAHSQAVASIRAQAQADESPPEESFPSFMYSPKFEKTTQHLKREHRPQRNLLQVIGEEKSGNPNLDEMRALHLILLAKARLPDHGHHVSASPTK